LEKEPLLTQLWEICTTVADEEAARTIGQSLLALRLAACIQVNGPIRSFYRWNGKLHEDAEWKLTIKTNQANLEACWNEVLRLHPYDLPELLANPTAKVSFEYGKWLNEQLDSSVVTSSSERWHVRIASRPSNAILGTATAKILGRSLPSLELPTGPSPISICFEELAERLKRLPNVHMEPDGAFTWGSLERRSTLERTWQLDGMIYDRDNRIEYVELKGNCDRATWEAFTGMLSGVECSRFVVQWIERGLWINEPDFKECIE
jgi:periplasmic divalent cation tolerance protein